MQPAATHPRSLRLPSSLLSLAALCASLAACGGHPPAPGPDDGGADAGVTGQSCQFDSDCAPPNFICAINGTCQPGCATAGCPLTQQCNTSSGRCVDRPDAGVAPDGGTGADGGSDGGTASDTLCAPCTINGDCHAGGLCVQDPSHTTNFCTQDCSTSACPSGYDCTTDRTGTKHQCYPSSGACPSSSDGGTTGGGDGGTVDPTLPSTNPNGCGFCGGCAVNDDCKTGSVCASGNCVPPCSSYVDCLLSGAVVATCKAVPNEPGKYCVSALGACIALPGPLAPLSGDVTCQPSGTNPSCTPAKDVPATLGANVAVTDCKGKAGCPSTTPLLASEDSITRDSRGRMAFGYIGVNSSGSSYMGVSSSTDDGATWTDRGQMKATTGVQSDPVLVTSKWTDGSGVHERMHYVWVGYTLDMSNPSQPTPKDMFMESSYSDDGGQTWSQGVKVSDTTDNANGTLLLDKPWVAVGPDQSLLLSFSIGDNNQQHMYARVSTDHGQSWGTKSFQIENGDNNHGHNLGMPVFDPRDPTGNTVYDAFITYTQIQATSANSVVLAKSTDHGKTWGTPIDVGGDDQVLFEPPSIAIDKAGHLYVGYVGSSASSGADGSKYWDAKVAMVDVTSATPVVKSSVRVSDDAGSCFQHIHTMVQVDPASGKVFAGWLDNRRASAAGGVYVASSGNLGLTWGASQRVSDQDFTFNPDHANSQLRFLGDYFGFFWDGAKMRFAWSDPRNGSSSQAFYAGGVPQ